MPRLNTIDLTDGESIRRRKRDLNSLPVNAATVIAIDPGGHTGWSLMSVHPMALMPEHPDVNVLDNMTVWQHGEIDGRHGKEQSAHTGVPVIGEAETVHHLIGLFRTWPGAAIVIEDFILRQFDKGRDLLSPVRITSALSQWLWSNDREYFSQVPAIKPSMNDDRLKMWGLYERAGGLGHARDADRHGIYFLRDAMGNNAKGRMLRQRAWPHLYGPGRPYATPE